MGSSALRHFIEAVAVIVWVRHLTGAERTFSPPRGERPSPTIYLFGTAIVVLGSSVFRAPLETRLVIPGLAAFIGSFALYEWARQSIQGKFFSYIYSKDTPQFLWTSGPYAYIRNPFYASYMLSYVGAAMMFPGATTFTVAVVMMVYFSLAARYEERKFENSPLAADYAAYRRRTGRFTPRLRSA